MILDFAQGVSSACNVLQNIVNFRLSIKTPLSPPPGKHLDQLAGLWTLRVSPYMSSIVFCTQ